MDAKPTLSVHTVLVTRPAEQAAGLCALIEAAGGRALRLPLLDIVPVEDPAAATELLSRPDWDWLIFVSANAVRHALALGAWRQGSARIAAVGEATAVALREAGVRVDLVPEPQFNSESLLAAPALAEVAGLQILIVRGAGGRELLADVLRERGAIIAYAEVYRRRLPTLADSAAWIAHWQQGGIDSVVVTSGEILGHLMTLLGEAGPELAARTPLVVIGERVASLARERGWQQVWATQRAGDQGLMDAILALRQNRENQREPSTAS